MLAGRVLFGFGGENLTVAQVRPRTLPAGVHTFCRRANFSVTDLTHRTRRTDGVA